MGTSTIGTSPTPFPWALVVSPEAAPCSEVAGATSAHILPAVDHWDEGQLWAWVKGGTGVTLGLLQRHISHCKPWVSSLPGWLCSASGASSLCTAVLWDDGGDSVEGPAQGPLQSLWSSGPAELVPAQLRALQAGAGLFQKLQHWLLPSWSGSISGQRWSCPATAVPWCSPSCWNEVAETYSGDEDALLAPSLPLEMARAAPGTWQCSASTS